MKDLSERTNASCFSFILSGSFCLVLVLSHMLLEIWKVCFVLQLVNNFSYLPSHFYNLLVSFLTFLANSQLSSCSLTISFSPSDFWEMSHEALCKDYIFLIRQCNNFIWGEWHFQKYKSMYSLWITPSLFPN